MHTQKIERDTQDQSDLEVEEAFAEEGDRPVAAAFEKGGGGGKGEGGSLEEVKVQ